MAETTPAPAIHAEPVVPVVVATPTPVQKRLAPEGIYFVVQAISVTTADGITGVKPGTQVTLLKNNGEMMHVTNGEIEFDVRRDQVTNDLDNAAWLSSQHIRKENALAVWQQQQRQTASAMEQQNKQQIAASQEATQKNTTAQQIQARIDALSQEEVMLRAQIRESYSDESRESYNRVVLGRITSKSQLVQDRPQMQARIEVIMQEKRRLSDELMRLQR